MKNLSIIGTISLFSMSALIFASWHEGHSHEGGSDLPIWSIIIGLLFFGAAVFDLIQKARIMRRSGRELPEIELGSDGD